MLRIRLLVLLFLAANFSARAYHIAGGDLTAAYIGNSTFRITLTLFRDCSNPIGAPFDDDIILGIYKKNDNMLFDSLHMHINNISSVGLTGNSCEPPPEVCMEVGDYIADIQLPAQPGGYYLVWERCCRNNTVVNIINPNNAGMAFYLELSDPALQSSSPVFNGAPSPYSCAGQIFQFNFDASDADGDSLVYELTTPLDGGHTSNNDPNPFSPGGQNTPPDPAPYSEIIWDSPYSLSNVTNGQWPVTINPLTGIMEGSAEDIGIYAIAVTVYEYRNGVLIGSVRREIEFTVIPCNGNTAPLISSTLNTTDTTIFATDTLCFSLLAVDPDGDSLWLSHSGDLFQSDPNVAIQPPFATSVDSQGIGNVVVPFCWESACNQARDSAYFITFEAKDTGCPIPARKRLRIAITVKPVPVPLAPNLLCIKILNNNALRVHIAPDSTLKEKYFSHYNVYRSKNGDSFQLYQSLQQFNLQHFTDSNALDNYQNNYCYMLSIVSSCGNEGGFSDTLCSVATANNHRNYLRTVSVADNREIKISWEDFPDGPYGIYHLFRRNNEPGTVAAEIETLASFTPMEFTDANVEVQSRSYCYTLINENVCGNVSPASDELCSILLQGNSETYLHRMHWNEFSNWRGGTDHYETERSELNSAEFGLIQNSNNLFAEDRDMPVTGGSYKYRIRAVEGTGSFDEVSFSNEIILQQQPLVWIPNAFSPNSDGNNDYWGVESAYVESLELELFNRWGQQVWNTRDKVARWDGQYSGTDSPEGVYYYRMTYKGYTNNKELELTGMVTLIR